MASHHIFKVLFVNQGKVYEVYARKVSHGSMLGFVEIEELVFGERAGVVLDPTEERIKSSSRTSAQLPADAFGAAHRRSQQTGRQQDFPVRGQCCAVSRFVVPAPPWRRRAQTLMTETAQDLK